MRIRKTYFFLIKKVFYSNKKCELLQFKNSELKIGYNHVKIKRKKRTKFPITSNPTSL